MSDEINAGTGHDIVLRDHDNVPVEHGFPTHLQVDTADGGTTKYVHESLGAEPVERTVELDFSESDTMTITPEEGQVFSSIVIPKPENLIPGNIAEGTDIAGIIGTMAGGGSGGGVRVASGITSVSSSSFFRFETNHGFKPDLIYTGKKDNFYPTSGNPFAAMGFSSDLIAANSIPFACSKWSEQSSGQIKNQFGTVAIDSTTPSIIDGTIHNADENGFNLSFSAASGDWYYVIVGGLT